MFSCMCDKQCYYFVAVSCRSCSNGTVELGGGEEGGGGGSWELPLAFGYERKRKNVKERGKMLK